MPAGYGLRNQGEREPTGHNTATTAAAGIATRGSGWYDAGRDRKDLWTPEGGHYDAKRRDLAL